MTSRGFIEVKGWAGKHYVAVTILAETPKRYRVRWEETDRKGAISLLPKKKVVLSSPDQGESE